MIWPGSLNSSKKPCQDRELLMQIKEMAENMGYEVLHGIVDCLWVIGKPISALKEAVERETGILTEVDTYDGITFLPMSDGTGD
jgi:DNA polymerase, archaea type